MKPKSRIFIAIALLIVIVLMVVSVEILRGWLNVTPELPPGSIPITLDGEFVAAFTPTDLDALQTVSFTDAEEGKTQEGWLLRDVIRLYMKATVLPAQTRILVRSSSSDKSAQLTWAEVDDPANWVMFDVAGRGTLKLVSVLERLDTRTEWVQDVDSIEIIR